LTPAILLQIIIAPALAAIVIFLLRYQLGKKCGWVAVLSLTYTTVLLLGALVGVYREGSVVEEYSPVINPNITLTFLADGLSISVALICNLLSLGLAIYSMKYVDHRIELIYKGIDRKSEIGYYACYFYLFLFFPVGFMGVSLASNLIVLYLFLEVLTITLYFLMAYFGYYERVKVAMMSLLWGIFSAILFLAGVLMIYSEVGSFQIDQISNMAGSPMAFWAIAVTLAGMVAKLAMVPLHVWMPWVHAEHPTCIAGLLAVYANIAAYVIVRTLVLPLWEDFEWFGPPIMVMSVVTMVYGSLLTLAQTDMKRIPACSTISQCSYSMLGIGALTSASIEGGLFFFLSHIMGKAVLFSTCGIVVYTTHIRDTKILKGLAHRMPLTAVLFIAGGMMLGGMPPFSSFAAELVMFSGVFERGDAIGITVGIIGLIAVLLTVGYAAYFALAIFFGSLPSHLDKEYIKDPPLSMSLPLIAIILLSVFLGLYPGLVYDLFEPVISSAIAAR
jgi:formate hydrogenlyase subunit 3/multisubunit Na+/H+ antiporter MnhD subunit